MPAQFGFFQYVRLMTRSVQYWFSGYVATIKVQFLTGRCNGMMRGKEALARIIIVASLLKAMTAPDPAI
jgi:hypothetical protein